MSSKRKAPIEGGAAVPVALAKADLGMKNKVVPIGGGTEIYYKKGLGQLVVRRTGRTGGLNARAKALKKCKNMRGDSAEACVKAALGVVPHSLTLEARSKAEAKRAQEKQAVKSRNLGVLG